MSSTIDLLFSYVREYSFRIMIVFLLLLFTSTGYYIYLSMYPSLSTKNKFVDVANANPAGKSISITLYHVDWCPHCKTALPEWEKFSNEYHMKTVNGFKISCVKVNCTDNEKPDIKNILEKDPVIDSFPTVRGVMPTDDGKDITIQFKSRISKDNLEKFVLSVTNQ